MKIDKFDIKILDELQKNSRVSVEEMSKVIGLSVTPCYRRLQRLNESGIIEKKAVELSRRKLGLNFEAYVEVKLANCESLSIERFERLVNLSSEIIECHTIQGNMDFILRVITRSSADFDRFLRARLVDSKTVASTETFIIMRRVVDRQALPMEQVALNSQ